jgi:hypothetical protein
MKMNNIEFEKPWLSIDSDVERNRLIKELEKEINSSHVLYGKKSMPIAKREDDDDVIFKTSDGSYALVHLTWSGKQEKDASFPFTEIFSSLKNLLNEVSF